MRAAGNWMGKGPRTVFSPATLAVARVEEEKCRGDARKRVQV